MGEIYSASVTHSRSVIRERGRYCCCGNQIGGNHQQWLL